MLARVAVVVSCPWLRTLSHETDVRAQDYRGHILVDCLVGPTEPVTSYRTATTGLVAEHFQAGELPTRSRAWIV
jgi:predicted dinucleotide-binding enzyme